jgi:hypothetical protein
MRNIFVRARGEIVIGITTTPADFLAAIVGTLEAGEGVNWVYTAFFSHRRVTADGAFGW